MSLGDYDMEIVRRGISLRGVYLLPTGRTSHISAKSVDHRPGKRVVNYVLNIPMPPLVNV